MKPLSNIKVLDFSTLLPGPMATLMMAEAGAEVIKVERPPDGEMMRAYAPKIGDDSLYFVQLNRGKRAISLNLKDAGDIKRLRPLLEKVDVLVEQFRPGVMDRLGLGYEVVKALNPAIVYCSISGYGQDGPKANKAAHDLNYMAESGLLSVVADETGAPVLPPTLIADIAGGAYPAFMNVLLGLFQVQRTGEGCHIDVSMNDQVLPFAYMQIGESLGLNVHHRANGQLTTGGSPRYNIYRTSDDRFLAAAPLEQPFWNNFCDVIALDEDLRDDTRDTAATFAAVRKSIGGHSAEYWAEKFATLDACVSVVLTIEEAVGDPHYKSRGVFDHTVHVNGREMPAVPVAISQIFRDEPGSEGFPRVGEANDELLGS